MRVQNGIQMLTLIRLLNMVCSFLSVHILRVNMIVGFQFWVRKNTCYLTCFPQISHISAQKYWLWYLVAVSHRDILAD